MEDNDDDEHSEPPPQLPMDMMYKIQENVTDPATLARLASSSRFWRHLIKDSTFLDNLRKRHRDHGFAPFLLLGFFYQQDREESAPDLWQHYMDQRRCLAPSFMPISELSRFAGGGGGSKAAIRPPPSSLSLETLFPGLGARLNFYIPIASQDSFVAFRHGRSSSAMDRVCVCNPLTGEVIDVARSLNLLAPEHYALFATDAQSLELVTIWIKKRRFIALFYSSVTRICRLGARAPALMPGLYLVSSAPPAAATSHGVIRWLCGSWKTTTVTHVATLHVDEMELTYLELPPEAKGKTAPLLANSAGGELLLLLADGRLKLSLWRHDDNSSCCWVQAGN